MVESELVADILDATHRHTGALCLAGVDVAEDIGFQRDAGMGVELLQPQGVIVQAPGARHRAVPGSPLSRQHDRFRNPRRL